MKVISEADDDGKIVATTDAENPIRILSRKSVKLMRNAPTDWDDDSLADFGLGFQVVNDLGKAGELGSVGSYTSGGAFYTSF